MSGNLADNKRARFDYELMDEYEAGLELSGSEVKATRLGRMSLAGARVLIRGGEAYLVGAIISPYQHNNPSAEFDTEKTRRLLLTKKELAVLLRQSEQAGLTIVPISVYNKGRWLKLRIAVARGKKKADKRQTIHQREADIIRHRTLKRG